MEDVEQEKPPASSNLDRLLSQLTDESLAYRLATARKSVSATASAAEAMKKVIENRARELRSTHGAGPDHKV